MQLTPPDNVAFGARISATNLHRVVWCLWVVLICCVVIGSLSPSTSELMVLVGRVEISDKVMHFCAYLILATLPVVGFRDRRTGVAVGLLMFILSVLLEAAQHFSPGRTVELGDIIANAAGVSCGTLLGIPIRRHLTKI